MTRMWRMLGSVLTTCVIAASGVNPTLASAGPDDSKTIATQEHVDSPKVFWDESAGNFVLRTNVGQNPPPIETTALWVGKGYNDAGHQQYIHPINQGQCAGAWLCWQTRRPALPGSGSAWFLPLTDLGRVRCRHQRAHRTVPRPVIHP